MARQNDKTAERAALTARLIAHPVPTITVKEYALLADRGHRQAFEDVHAGRVEAIQIGRSIRIKLVPLMRSLGFEFDAPTALTR